MSYFVTFYNDAKCKETFIDLNSCSIYICAFDIRKGIVIIIQNSVSFTCIMLSSDENTGSTNVLATLALCFRFNNLVKMDLIAGQREESLILSDSSPKCSVNN